MEARGETDRTIRGYVTRIALEPQRARRGDYLFRGLEILSETDAPRTFLIIPESVLEFGRPDLYGFPGLCWEGAEIAAFKAQLNNTLEDGSTILVVTPETELVLEPFRPVSVTEAVEAAGCIRLVDLRYRVAPARTFWMAKDVVSATPCSVTSCTTGVKCLSATSRRRSGTLARQSWRWLPAPESQ